MNTAIVLLVVCATAVEVLAGPQGLFGGHEPLGEKMRQFVHECAAAGEADMESIKVSLDGGPANKEVQCFYLCLGKKTGIINKDGSANKKNITHVPPQVYEEHKEEYREIRAICAEIITDNKCETAWLIWKCLQPLPVPPYLRQRRV